MYPYTLTGLTAELYAAAAKQGIAARSNGPAADRFWVLLRRDGGWCDAPRDAMPLLIGVDDLDGAVTAAMQVDGVLRELTLDEVQDAETILLLTKIGGSTILGGAPGR